MKDSSRPPAMMPNVRLGIRGLPNLTNALMPGGLYVLVAETASARFPLLASSLDGTLKDGRRCSVIVPGNPEHFLQRLEAVGEYRFQDPLAQGQLQVFVTQDEFPKKMFRFGTSRLVREFEHFDIGEHGYLIFDQADDLLSLHDISLALEQIETLARWLAQRQLTALLVLLRLTEAQAANLNALMDNLSGIARLGSDETGLRLAFDYWQSPESAVVARHHALNLNDAGHYETIQRSTTAPEAASSAAGSPALMQAPPAPNEPTRYFHMDPDLGSLAAQMPGQWRQVDSFVGMMHATRQSRAPVVILCYQQDTSLRPLAEAVHTLRVNLGPHAQLILQEKGASLRYQNEALLLRLGLNLVIHRDVPANRMPLLLTSLSGQIFSRDVDIDFSAALASVMPARLRGYQPPSAFVREVRDLLDRSTPLQIPFVLLTGLPVQNESMLDVLALIKVSRAGDLVTADTRHCYIFLHACQPPVALAALERILGMPVGQVFETLRLQVTHEDVARELDTLLHNASTGMALDYTAQLPVPETPQPLTADPAQPVQAGADEASPASRHADDPRLQASPLGTDPASPATLYRQTGKPAASVYGRQSAPRAQRKTPSSGN